MLKSLASATASLAAAAGIIRPWRAIATVTAKRDAGDQTVTVEGRTNVSGRIVELRVTDAAGAITPGPKKSVVKGLVGLTLSDLGLIARRRGGLAIATLPVSPSHPRTVRIDLRSNAFASL